ncbi:MAG TPA: tetratricopeptide repeat protein [Bryobacteraceae bacterium]|jgi:predicted CXXCH cytochrome family protein|nr:tetratricopeptide repeat protein [Bryobacteraceae bacterium]
MSCARLAGLLAITSLANAGGNGFVGRDACAGCHKSIALTHLRTNMARTWQGMAINQQFPANYFQAHAEGPAPEIKYELQRTGQSLQYRVQMPGQPVLDFPVESMVGGHRHGISFLFRVPSLDGLPLPRARLLEARYFHYAERGQLALSLGFPEEKPSTYETAMGRVLTPYLEVRCLSCHGAPRTHGTRVETGVGCENCHGPGQPHLAAVGAHARDLRISNPDKLPVAERFRPCSQCHAGSSVVEDPMPDDTLISDQVTALKNSECWRQSAGQITCTNCHDPHQDAPRPVLVARAEKTCLGCHSAMVTKHAGLCPVNRRTGCVECHMASETRGAFVIAEHWIRVQPGQETKAAAYNPAWRTTVTPKHLYLRMIVLDDREKAAAIREQLLSGGSFFELARANSIDQGSAMNGGYLGDLDASQLDPAWSAAALKLQPGEISTVVEAKGKYITLQRMPRNFREDAEVVFNHAMDLRKQGKQQESMNEMLEALKIYPHLLRALTWLGAMYGQSGNPSVSAGILTIATRLYPRDAGAHFNLALAYGALGKAEEIAEYQRTIEIDGDYVLAYLNWGAALYGKGQYEDAIKIYRKGIDVNPLFASLHYSLGVALDQDNKTAEGAAEMALATRIDPNVGAR